MRMLDMVHFWAARTHSQYQAKLGLIRRFEHDHGLHILRQTCLERPPSGPEIPLMWCQEAYSLRKSPRRQDAQDSLTLAFSTIRQLRSAASQYFAWDMLVSSPTPVYMDNSRRLLHQPCRATDGFSYTLFSSGMSARIGDEARPSVPLLDRHVRALDRTLNERYLAATLDSEKRELALAGFANLSLWLGWLRSGEKFGLNWEDCAVTEPANGPSKDLPVGIGAVCLRMLPETKSARSHRPDVVMAYLTLSGYHIGKWFHRARHWAGIYDWRQVSRPIFCKVNGTRWTSAYFRHVYLYPSLHAQRAAGDAYLMAFDGSPGNTLESKFWSLHCYRRGARGQVSRGGTLALHRFRRATDTQVYEHARWRRKRSGEKIDVIYREWPLIDRIQLTLYCQ